MNKLKVVFMGTPSFAVPVLEELIDKCNVLMVVCQPDRKKNRHGDVLYPETKKVAIEHNIETFQPVKLRKDYQKIIDANPDIIITCAYGQIVPDEILNFPKYGCINIHGSLLPELRGGAPIHWAIIRGYKETGITIMDMNSRMDAGDIITQASIKIDDDMTLEELYDKMSYLGRDLLMKVLPNIISGKVIRIVQDDNEATFAYNISKEDMKIDFSKKSKDIKNLVRGLCPVPGAYCYLDGKRIKIYEVDILDDNSNGKYGEIVKIDKDGIICNTSDKLIKIKDIAIEGKKRCKVYDYLNGVNKDKLVGKVFE